MFSWATVQRPIIALAPLDGYTDQAMRELVKDIEPRVVTWTEFTSSDFLFFKPSEAKTALGLSDKQHPVIVQLFGKHPEHFAVAARLAEDLGADGIDINMGCPAKKVVNSMHGAYLMTKPELGMEIISAVRRAVKIPLSVKTRLGWQDDSQLIEFVKKLESVGIDLITIHGRTYAQAFKGAANWEPIYRLKQAVSIPVIGNGDVRDLSSAQERLGNLDGVMVGRASMGNPWVFRELAAGLYDGVSWSSQKDVSFAERLRVMRLHTQLLVESKGVTRGTSEARKHLASYIHGMNGAAQFRARLVRIESLAELEEILSEIAQVVGNVSATQDPASMLEV